MQDSATLVRDFVWIAEFDQGPDDPVGYDGWQMAGSENFLPLQNLTAHDLLHHIQGDMSLEEELLALGHWLFEIQASSSGYVYAAGNLLKTMNLQNLAQAVDFVTCGRTRDILDPPQTPMPLPSCVEELRTEIEMHASKATTLEAAKAAAEACLRAWVARLNASLGGA